MGYHSPLIYALFWLALSDMKDGNLSRLGAQIRALRKEKGLSQEGFALKADVDRSYIGSIERGERNVSFLMLVKIASCLDCDVAHFTKEIPHGTKRQTETR